MANIHNTIELLLPSSSGNLEALLTLPETAKYPGVAVICHPHPLYGGTMHTKAVFTATHAFLELGIPALRFNFRGVGKSSGKFDEGRGEQDDVRAAIDYMVEKYPGKRIIVSGHSFGAWMGMKAGCIDARVHVVIGMGTPVGFVDMGFLMYCTKPRLFIHGMQDKLIPVGKVEELYSELPEPKKLIRIEGADHFFTGMLDELSEAVQDLTKEYLPFNY